MMIFRSGFLLLMLATLALSVLAEEAHLFVKNNGAYYAATPNSEGLDTGIIVDENLVNSLNDKQYKSIIRVLSVPVERIPFTTINWNRWHTHQIFVQRFAKEAVLEKGKIITRDKQTLERKEFLNLSLYLIAGFFLLLFFSSLFRENSKVELHKFILAVAAIMSVIVGFWTLLIMSAMFPGMPDYMTNLIASSLFFNVLSFIGVLVFYANLSFKFARAASVASMIVVGFFIFIM